MMKISQHLPVVCLLTALMANDVECANMSDQVFGPLATVHFQTNGETETFISFLKNFAADKKLLFAQGNYDGKDHHVSNFELSTDKSRQTHIGASNYSSKEFMKISIYSHENKQIWNALWQDFLIKLNVRFGKERVEPILEDRK